MSGFYISWTEFCRDLTIICRRTFERPFLCAHFITVCISYKAIKRLKNIYVIWSSIINDSNNPNSQNSWPCASNTAKITLLRNCLVIMRHFVNCFVYCCLLFYHLDINLFGVVRRMYLGIKFTKNQSERIAMAILWPTWNARLATSFPAWCR